MNDAHPDTQALGRSLRSGRNADGGWGYYPGKASRLEPTCWALIALRDVDPSVLAAWPAEDGLLRERHDGDVNFAFHALALLAMLARRVEHASGNAMLASRLQTAKGIVLDQSPNHKQNNQLQGWSWNAGTFSWVEPTAWALLALRKHAAAAAPTDPARLREAETLLVDRCCKDGGWNYGNANMLGKDLRPYVPTTAVALLALQKRDQPTVTKSVGYLEGAAVSECSAIALSLAVLALAAHGRPTAGPRALLAAQCGPTIDLGQQLGAAMALCALQKEAADDAFLL
jgi:hypothetical protein